MSLKDDGSRLKWSEISCLRASNVASGAIEKLKDWLFHFAIGMIGSALSKQSTRYLVCGQCTSQTNNNNSQTVSSIHLGVQKVLFRAPFHQFTFDNLWF